MMDTTEAVIENHDTPRTVVSLYRGADGQWYPSRARCSALDNVPLIKLRRDWPPEEGKFWQLDTAWQATVKEWQK